MALVDSGDVLEADELLPTVHADGAAPSSTPEPVTAGPAGAGAGVRAAGSVTGDGDDAATSTHRHEDSDGEGEVEAEMEMGSAGGDVAEVEQKVRDQGGGGEHEDGGFVSLDTSPEVSVACDARFR